MIAITCNLNTDQLGRRIQMWIDHHALFKPITKATLRLERGRIAETVSAAIALAHERADGTGASRPAGGRGARAGDRSRSRRRPPAFALAPAPDAEVARAGELIAAAKRPVAVIGSSAMRARRSVAAAQGGRTPQPAVRHDHHGQGPDRRGPSALARLHRARLPADAAQAPALRRPDRRARLRHHRGRVRGLDRRRAAAFDRHRAAGRRAVGQSRPSRRRRSRRLARAARRAAARDQPLGGAGARRSSPRVPAGAAARHQFVQRACGDRRGAPRAAARRRAFVRRRRAYPPDRQPVDSACAEDAS